MASVKRGSSRESITSFAASLVQDRRRTSVHKKLVALHRTSLSPHSPLAVGVGSSPDVHLDTEPSVLFHELDVDHNGSITREDLKRFSATTDARLTDRDITSLLRFLGAAVLRVHGDDDGGGGGGGGGGEVELSLGLSGLHALMCYFSELFSSTAECLLPNPVPPLHAWDAREEEQHHYWRSFKHHHRKKGARTRGAGTSEQEQQREREEIVRALFIRLDPGSDGLVDAMDLRNWCRMLPLGRPEGKLIRIIMRQATGISADGLLHAATYEDLLSLLYPSNWEALPNCVKRDRTILRLELEAQAKMLDRITGRHRGRQQLARAAASAAAVSSTHLLAAHKAGALVASTSLLHSSGLKLDGWAVPDWHASPLEKQRHADAEGAYLALAKIILARHRRRHAEEERDEAARRGEGEDAEDKEVGHSDSFVRRRDAAKTRRASLKTVKLAAAAAERQRTEEADVAQMRRRSVAI